MRYTVTKELKTETKVSSSVYIKDFFFLIGYIGVSYLIKGAVHPSIRWSFMLFSIAIAIILTLPSAFNKKRRNYQSLIIFLRRDNSLYRSIPIRRNIKGDSVNG